MKPRWRNPYADSPGFIDLGRLDIGGHYPVNADLYVFPSSNGDSLHFGGRHSDDPPDYTSGSCSRTESGWEILGGLVIQTAAARFFANHGKTLYLIRFSGMWLGGKALVWAFSEEEAWEVLKQDGWPELEPIEECKISKAKGELAYLDTGDY